jgi:hypothetical protein
VPISPAASDVTRAVAEAAINGVKNSLRKHEAIHVCPSDMSISHTADSIESTVARGRGT